MATAEGLRRLREEQSVFSALYDFAHLSNLSAANVSPLGGLLAQSGVSDKQAERIEEYLRRRGLLD
jgi:predicted DNA-binding protein with PD1-like motif